MIGHFSRSGLIAIDNTPWHGRIIQPCKTRPPWQ
jgi:hypothetical protein